MALVFISYARSTEAQAERLERGLIAAGHQVWRDNALAVHRSYADEIAEQIAAAAAVIVLWSADAARSEWVRSEANRARELGKLVQVSLDRTHPPMPFDQMHCGDLSGWDGGEAPGWRKVLQSIASLAGATDPRPALLASNHSLPAPRASGDVLLAVMAFENLSGDADFLYFSDGISDEILDTVARTTDLKVIARSSSFQLRGPEKTPANAAARLNATHILDGAVRRSGERVRITAQLVDCATQTPIWSDRFDRDLSDIFALQDEIAGAIAEALKAAFAPRGGETVDPAAYDLYLRARVLDSSRISYDIQLLEEAVARAPTFAKAWESLTIAYGARARFDAEASLFEERRTKMEAAAARVRKLDPTSAAPDLGAALVLPICGAFLEMEQLIAQALAASPTDPAVLTQASHVAGEVGRCRVALAYITQAYEMDPLHPLTAAWYAAQLATNYKRAESMALFDQFVPRWPDDGFIRMSAIGRAGEMGDWERVERYAAEPGNLGMYADGIGVIVQAIRDIRDWTPEKAVEVIAQLKAIIAVTGTVLVNWLGPLCELGLSEEVYELIDQASFAEALRPGGRMLAGEVSIAVLFYPSAEVMRRDPRFVRLCARLGLCDYWIATNRWPDCADALASYYDFRAAARRENARMGETQPA
jgi:adenylate cyclase